LIHNSEVSIGLSVWTQ